MKRARFVEHLGHCVWICALTVSGYAEDLGPAYEPDVHAIGSISVSGDVADRDLIETLQAAFMASQPGVEFSNSLHGPESALAAVYTGTADLAFMAREIREPMERMAFQWVKLERPYAIQYANAGFDKDRPGTQLAVFVHEDNPVHALSMPQLDAVFGAEHKRGLSNIRVWGDLGAGGEWQDRPIHVLGPKLDSIPALFFRRTVMLDSRKWNPGYREFDDAREALRTLSGDVSAIVLAPLALQSPGARPLAIAPGPSESAVALTRESAISQEYPLHRSVSVMLHRPDGEAFAPPVREFLRFVLSAEGQSIIAEVGSYLPLSASIVVQERERLE